MEAIGGTGKPQVDTQLVGTYSTRNLDEYLADINNGMDIERDMANSG